jgi:hypothetical protein
MCVCECDVICSEHLDLFFLFFLLPQFSLRVGNIFFTPLFLGAFLYFLPPPFFPWAVFLLSANLQSDSEGDAECATSCVQILLPGETEDGELMNHDDDDYQPTFETAANATSPVTPADGKATTNNVERNQWQQQQQQQQQPSVVIELTPMTYSPVTSDTCPQCSSSAAKTSFMTFDELADASALIITNSPAAAANNPSAAAVTNC